MCGIIVIVGKQDETLLDNMMSLLVHRGPDARGMYVDKNSPIMLGHQRLSIMDPAGGNQPIYNESNSRAIIANGEIYNAHYLRSQLEYKHGFRTKSDTETALHLYENSGKSMVQLLDGMYAFAIADGADAFIVRDPIGIKPLYYGHIGETMVFSSELKALADYADDVHEFPPGTYYHTQNGFRSYYVVPDLAPREMPFPMRIEQIRATLENAINKRLMSDVPLGAFLSGGLDSSIITAIAKRQLGTLHTFSVGLEGSRDLDAARRISKYLGTIHHEYVITKDDIINNLPTILYHLESYDQDLVRSAIPCYFTSRLAAEQVKVILTGEGADELFAGYAYYHDIKDSMLLHAELRRSVCSLHNINLQRVDRLTMAHSIEGRVPFLDTEMIALAQTIPPELKLYGNADQQRIEKWILRAAFEDLLPSDIVWRSKEQFDEGSGVAGLLNEEAKRWMTPVETENYIQNHPTAQLRSSEECYYHRMLTGLYAKPDLILKNVARWADRPDTLAA